MPDLLLHIGHHKTGSSFVQNTLRANREVLVNHGLLYPSRGDNPRKNAITGVAEGNGKDLFVSESKLRGALSRLQLDGRAHLLLSSEALLSELCRHQDLEFVARAAAELGYDHVRILLFIRDPIANAASAWQQDVKTGGTNSIEERFATFSQPEVVARFLDLVGAVEEIDLTVQNYSRCADRIVDVVTEWLGIPQDALEQLPVSKVNRSLSQGELALKMELNRVLGANCSFFIKAINEWLPELNVQETRPPLDVQRQLIARLQPAMDSVNARIGAEAHYQPDFSEPNPLAERFEFTSAQIGVVAEGLGGEILRLRKSRDKAAAELSARELATALLKRVRNGVVRSGPQS